MLIAILVPSLFISGAIAVLLLRKQRMIKVPAYLMLVALLCIGLGLYLIILQVDVLNTHLRFKITVPWHIYMKLGFGVFLFLIGSVVDMVGFLSGNK